MTQATAATHPYNGITTRLAEDEAELNALEVQRTEEAEPVSEPVNPQDEPLTAEEKTYRKRYGDLRTYQQTKEREYQAQIIELRKQLLAANAPKNVDLPATEEELAGFLNEYPQLAGLIETMIAKKVQAVASNSDERFAQLEAEKAMAQREKALQELLRMHPDIADIRDSEDFNAWVKEQPDNIRWALLENSTDARAAARALDLYKLDRDRRQADAPRESKTAATAVRTPRTTKTVAAPEAPGKRIFKESEIQAMRPAQFEALFDEITAAQREGRIEHDLSGGAR